jgi:hypothetical protein
LIEINKKQLILIIGIGAFILSAVNGFTYLIKVISRDFQIWLNQEPILNFWITELSQFLIFILLGILALRIFIRNYDFSLKRLMKIFIFWIIAYFISQLLQYLHTKYLTSFLLESKFEEFKMYSEYIRENYSLKSYQSSFVFFRYLIFGVIIYIGQKTVANTV